MEAKIATRTFTYQGMELPDLAPSQAPDGIRSLYAMQYPELTNAQVQGPQVSSDGVLVYSFVRAVGDKGHEVSQGVPVVPFAERLAAIAAGQADPMRPLNAMRTIPVPFNEEPVQALVRLQGLIGTRMQPPSESLPAML